MEVKMKNNVEKRKSKKKLRRILKLSILFLFLILLISYVVVSLIYSNGNFTITLDKNLYTKRSLIVYDDPNYKVYRSELFMKTLPYFDNMAEKWLPTDLDAYDGAHNGDNYMAYTFYIENTGADVTDYWTEMFIDDVLKGLDDVVRVRLYRNGNYITYAKVSNDGITPEKGTVSFKNNELIMQEHIENFKPGDINKYTIVVWLEGNDSECTDNILGGEITMHMEFNSQITNK